MSVNTIAGLANTGMALSIASGAFPKKSKKKSIHTLTGTAVNTIVGSSLLKASAASVASL